MTTTTDAVAGQDVSAQAKSVPRSFKRIRLVSRPDFLACYSLLASYINHPETAHLVEECIVDPQKSCGYYPFTRLDGPPTGTVAVGSDDGVHRSIEEYVRTLGLGEETIGKMVKALDEYKELLQAPPVAHRFGQRPKFNPDFDLTVATLLISLCPNITILRVYGVYENTILGQFFLKNNYGKLQKPALQKLKEVQLHPVNCMDDRYYAYLESLWLVRYFHRLPSIQTLSLEGFEDYQADDNLFPAKSSPGIKKIHISHSDMTGSMIGTIIRIPKALEELSLSSYGLQNTDGGTSTVSRKTLTKCLLDHRDSLMVLDLDVAITGNYEGGEEERYADVMGNEYLIQDKKDSDSALPLWAYLPDTREHTPWSIGSMHVFKALTHLSIRIGLVLGYNDINTYGTPTPSASYRLVDALPPNLEFLRLYGYQRGQFPHIDAHVTELLEKKDERFPRLKGIEGVDEFLPGVPGQYGPEPDEEDVWKRPKGNLDWLEV